MKKWFLVLLMLGLVLGGALFAGHSWLKGRFDRENLVAELEKAWNCRVTMESTEVTLLGSPSKVILREVRLFPRDEEVKKAYGDRAAIDAANSLVLVKEAVLHVKLSDVIQKTANIEKLVLEGAHLNLTIDKEGNNPLATLFKKPRVESAEPKEPKSPPSTQPKKAEGFHADDLFLAIRAQEAAISNLTAKIDHKQAKKVIEIRDLDLHLRDINIDPKQLETHNHCDYELNADFTVFDRREDRLVGDVKLTGSGMVKPFDASTKLANPLFALTLKVQKDSLVGGAPLTEQLSKKDRRQMEKYNLDFSTLALGGKLKEDAVFQLHGQGSLVRIAEEVKLSFPQYDISVVKGSWWNSAADEINMELVLLGDAEITREILGQAQKALEDKIGASLAALAQATVQGTLVNEQGRLVIPLQCEGRLSKPDVRLNHALGELQDTLKDTGRSLLEGLFKN